MWDFGRLTIGSDFYQVGPILWQVADNRKNDFANLVCLFLSVSKILVFPGIYDCKFETLVSCPSDQR